MVVTQKILVFHEVTGDKEFIYLATCTEYGSLCYNNIPRYYLWFKTIQNYNKREKLLCSHGKFVYNLLQDRKLDIAYLEPLLFSFFILCTSKSQKEFFFPQKKIIKIFVGTIK